MNRKPTLRWLLPAAAFLLAASPLLAGPGHPGQGPLGFGPHGWMEELGLTDAQKAQVHDIFEKYKDGALGEKMRAMGEAHEALGALIHDPAASDAQVRESAKAATAFAVEIAVERHHMASEILALLTPEQKQKAKELHEAHPHGHHGPPPEGMEEGF